jgi:endonuclease I
MAWADPYDAPANYYNTATGTGAILKAQLNNIIDGHTVLSYDSARSSLQVTDADPNDPGNMLLVYNRASLDVAAINPGGSIPGWDSGVSWNREHTWPDSRGLGSSGPDYSDLHHLRPSDPGINSARGNKNFGGAYGAQPYGAVNDGGAMWYPGDSDAGMIARQEFYMATRYDGADSGTIDLELQPGNPAASAGLGNINRMLEWHYQAVPDDFELRRNDVIHDNYQGNRNPFVDHPEFAWSIFKDQQNDSQLYVGGSAAADGSSSLNVNLGEVIVGAAVPAAQNVTLNRNGFDGSYYEVSTSGDATSSVDGRYNAFAINNTGTDSTSLAVGLNTTTAAAGLKSGSLAIDNLDITTQGGAGVGANDGSDTVNVALAVLDHAEPSFNGATDQNMLAFNFGSVLQGSASPIINFDIFNLESTALYTAALDFDNVLGSGDTSVLLTDLTTFGGLTALQAGLSNGFLTMLDTSTPGIFSASYFLSFSDENLPGSASRDGMTLTLTGSVVAVPEPSTFVLVALGLSGLGVHRLRRKRSLQS